MFLAMSDARDDPFQVPEGTGPPVYARTTSDATEAAFGEQTYANPRWAAFAWWRALLIDGDASTVLALTDPRTIPAWGDFKWAHDKLYDAALASFVHLPDAGGGRVAYVKAVLDPPAGSNVVVREGQQEVRILTLAMQPDGTWKVWGLGLPAEPREVLGGL